MKLLVEPSSEERMCIPEYLGFDKLNRILIAYIKAGADRKAVSYRDASVRSGIAHTMVSINNKFFVYAGFLTEEGKGRFKLTENGSKYVQLLDWGRLDEAKEPLRVILKECSLVDVTLDYVSINEQVARDDLRRMIGSRVEVSRARRYMVGINALIDMLVFSGLLQEEDGTLKRGKQIEPRELPIEVAREPITATTPWSGLETPTLLTKPKQVSMPISLTVNVSDVTDVQKLREILRAIKEELLEEKKPE